MLHFGVHSYTLSYEQCTGRSVYAGGQLGKNLPKQMSIGPNRFVSLRLQLERGMTLQSWCLSSNQSVVKHLCSVLKVAGTGQVRNTSKSKSSLGDIKRQQGSIPSSEAEVGKELALKH